MHFDSHIRANVLPSVIVVSALMLLLILALLAYNDFGALMYERTLFNKNCRADIESAFVLYQEYPNIANEIQLYDSIPASKVTIVCRPWGLYETVSITHQAGKIDKTSLMGLRVEPHLKVLYYVEGNSQLTLTGNTNLMGKIAVPSGGIVYGRSGATFFSGRPVEQSMISVSDNTLPLPCNYASSLLKSLFSIDNTTAQKLLSGDSLTNSFYGNEPTTVICGKTMDCFLSGNIIVFGDDIDIVSSSRLHDIVIVGRKITVNDNFRGRVQLFASDTITVGRNVSLEYPSGIYSGNYASLKEGSLVSGYVIVNTDSDRDKSIKTPNYRQSRTSRVRGLLYIKGNGYVQGIISGVVYIDRAVYYSTDGYWKDMLFDITIMENPYMALPLWMDNKTKRESIVWLD